MKGPLEAPLHPSLVRPILLGGAERELVLVNSLVIVVLILGIGPHLLTFLLAGLLGTVGHSVLVVMGRFDPQMWQVYRRHLVYQAFYPARALAHVSPLPVPAFDAPSR